MSKIYQRGGWIVSTSSCLVLCDRGQRKCSISSSSSVVFLFSKLVCLKRILATTIIKSFLVQRIGA